MPRYELRQGTSAKFWSIEHEPKYKWLITSWGKIGTAGQTKKTKYKQPHLCVREQWKLVREKLGKGYRIVTGAPHVPTDVKRNAELEASIAEAPADRESWSVYADWLQEAGDVRGEYIALHLGKRKERAKAYAKQHANALWGDARYLIAKQPFKGRRWEGWDDEGADYEDLGVSLAYAPSGFVKSALFSGLEEYGHIAGAVADLLDAPLGMFVEELSFAVGEGYEGSNGQPNYDLVAQSIGAAERGALRSVSFAHDGYQRSWTETGDLSRMLESAPRLERLDISLGTIRLGKQLDLPALKSLRLVTGGLDASNVRAIAAAAWPQLEELVVYFGKDRYGGNATIKDVRALLAAKFPKLRRLALCNSEHMQSQIAAAVLGAPLVKQLAALDLSRGTLTDGDVAAIVAGAKALPRLQLDLSDNYFSPDAEKTLRKQLGKRGDVGGQRYHEMIDEHEEYGQEDWAIKNKETFRYASIGE